MNKAHDVAERAIHRALMAERWAREVERMLHSGMAAGNRADATCSLHAATSTPTIRATDCAAEEATASIDGGTLWPASVRGNVARDALGS